MNKTLIAAISAALLVVVPVGVSAQGGSNMTAQEKYDALVEKGIFEGMASGEAGQLDEEMTRAQAAKIVALLMGLDGGEPAPTPSTEVPGSDWASGYINAAVEAGLMEGQGNGTFDPSGDITLEELAKVMVEALGLEPDADATVEGDTSDWAAAYVAAAVEAGLLDTQSDYTSPATRDTLVGASYTYGVSQQNDQAIEDAVQDAGSDSGLAGGPDWADFPYYSVGDISPEAPSPYGPLWATYSGRMAGAFTDGEPVNASLHMEFDLQAQMFTADIGFSDGTATLVDGRWTKVNDITGTFHGGAFGDNSVNGSLNGAFFGPNNEEVGGTWDMNVTGHGNASGKFGAKK